MRRNANVIAGAVSRRFANFHATINRPDRRDCARHGSYFSGVQRMGIIGIIGTIIVGFIVGLLARWFMPGVDKLGFLLTTALGIGGSVIGGFISGLIWKSPDGKFHPAGWIMSILGAMLLLWAYNNYMR
jgi:uncharacterized membrane protein YeaQ/YmgE (transglycosylase-associated protein family)